MKPNHHSLAYKQQKQPNKTYKDLKQKQKMKMILPLRMEMEKTVDQMAQMKRVPLLPQMRRSLLSMRQEQVELPAHGRQH